MEQRFSLGKAPHHRWRRSFCLQFPQQKGRVKVVATWPNQCVTCKEETRRAPIAEVQANTSDTGKEHSETSSHQEVDSYRPNRGAHNLNSFRNWEPATITSLSREREIGDNDLPKPWRQEQDSSMTWSQNRAERNGEDGEGAAERRSRTKATNLPKHRRRGKPTTLYPHALNRRAWDWHTTRPRPPSTPRWNKIINRQPWAREQASKNTSL